MEVTFQVNCAQLCIYTLVAFFRSKIRIKLMKRHVFLLGLSISIAGTVQCYIIQHFPFLYDFLPACFTPFQVATLLISCVRGRGSKSKRVRESHHRLRPPPVCGCACICLSSNKGLLKALGCGVLESHIRLHVPAHRYRQLSKYRWQCGLGLSRIRYSVVRDCVVHVSVTRVYVIQDYVIWYTVDVSIILVYCKHIVF